MRGAKPAPTKLKLLKGEPNKKRINDKEPNPRPDFPEVPDFLDDIAKEEYARLGKELYDLGLLTNLDRTALASYAQAYSLWVRYSKELEGSGLILYSEKNGIPYVSPKAVMVQSQVKSMMKILSEFGMTPSSRSRITVKKPERDDDDLY